MMIDTGANVSPTVHVAIPVQDEVELLPACIDALRRQEGVRLIAWFCVNQPEAWQNDRQERTICEANQVCLRLLEVIDDLDVRILDRTSPGRGWPPKHSGVGQARKELMDEICMQAAPNDIIVSLDADTVAPPNYLQSVVAAFASHPTACGVAARERRGIEQGLRRHEQARRAETALDRTMLHERPLQGVQFVWAAPTARQPLDG